MIGRSTLLAGAAVAVALALQISSGFYDPWAVALVSLAAAAAVFGALWRGREGNPVAAQALLGAGSAAGLGFHLFTNPTFSADVRAFQGGFRWFAVISLVVLSAYLCIHLRASLIRARFLLLLLCFAVMGLVVLRAADAGVTGGLRYGLLALVLAGAWLLARAWPGNGGELAAALVLFQPRTLFVLEQGWPEPAVFFCFALVVHALARCANRALVGLALALLTFVFTVAALLATGTVAGSVGGPPIAAADPLSLPSLIGRSAPLAVAGILFGAAVLALSFRRANLATAVAGAGAALALVLVSTGYSFANGWWRCSAILAAASAPAVLRVRAGMTRGAPETLATAAGAE